MRIDETLYHLLGDGLAGLTAEHKGYPSILELTSGVPRQACCSRGR